MESGAKGCEVIVSGKLRAARAKAMKFKDGYMLASGERGRGGGRRQHGRVQGAGRTPASVSC